MSYCEYRIGEEGKEINNLVLERDGETVIREITYSSGPLCRDKRSGALLDCQLPYSSAEECPIAWLMRGEITALDAMAYLLYLRQPLFPPPEED